MSEWLFGFLTGIFTVLIPSVAIDRYFSRRLNRLVDEAFVRGADLSVKNHARAFRKEHRIAVQGFAVRCPDCFKVSTCIQSVKDEYWHCLYCGTRLPAPLPDESEVAG